MSWFRCKANEWVMQEMLRTMPEAKRKVLVKALDRNEILTSSRVLSNVTMRVYKEGWYLIMEGTRCSVRVWCYDRDAEMVHGRKPNESTLTFYYEDWMNGSESDYEGF